MNTFDPGLSDDDIRDYRDEVVDYDQLLRDYEGAPVDPQDWYEGVLPRRAASSGGVDEEEEDD